jgi:hypothetical protein
MLHLYMHPLAWRANDFARFATMHPPQSCDVYAIRFLPSDDLQWLKLYSVQVDHFEKMANALNCNDLAGPPEQLSLVPLFTVEPHQELRIEVRNMSKGFPRAAIPFLVTNVTGTRPWEFMMRNPAQR